jgi:hypothetical protein
MVNYRERWQTNHSVDFVPRHLRDLCDDSLTDIFSDSPLKDNEAQLIAARKSLMKKHRLHTGTPTKKSH